MREIKATRRELRLALETVLDEKGVTDRVTRTSLIECFEQDCKHDWNAAGRAFARGIRMALASGSSDEAYLSRPGKVFVGATDQLVHLAAGGKETAKELPRLNYGDFEDRETLAELVEQKIRTAQRHGKTLSFASAAEEVMKKEFGSGAAENAPPRMAAGAKKKSSADYSPDELHDLTIKEIAAAKANGETLSYFQAARRVMVRLNRAA